jgi:hypothetical protein
MREACMSTNHSEPRLQLIPLWLEHLASRFPRRASATGSKIERCPRASADKLLEYLGGHARACGISSKSANLPSDVHGLPDVVRPNAARVRQVFMTLPGCTSGDERFTAGNFFQQFDALRYANASDIFSSGAFAPAGAKK